MKHGIYFVLLGFFAPVSVAEEPVKRPDNYTTIRLTISNDQGEILMRETQFGWMTPALRYQSRQTLTALLHEMAATHGVSISEPVLSGVFTYQYEFNDTISTRLFYSAKYVSGDLKPGADDRQVRWMSTEQALEKLHSTVPSLAAMTRQVLHCPDIVWGGAFELRRKDGKLDSVTVQDFYDLRQPQMTARCPSTP